MTTGDRESLASLSGAIELAVALGQVDREAAELAREQLVLEEDSCSLAQVSFLLDLDEELIDGFVDLAHSHPDESSRSGLRRRLFGAAGQPAPLTRAQLDALDDPAAAVSLDDSGDVSLVGRTLDGYEVLELLGEGGMGRVYRARQTAVHREVALKVLTTSRIGDAGAVQRFLREGRAAAGVNHPNVVTCHDMGRDGDQIYVAMELLDGGDLEERVRKMGGSLSEQRALSLMADACRGLVALEEAGLVHRDIKPANVFLTKDGRAKLGDLGLACSRMGDDRVTRTGLVVGTPAYMAPEQAEGTREPDIRADLYALGATLYRLVTGESPFHGSELSVLRQKLDHPPPDPKTKRPELSPAVAQLIRRTMARQPENRPASATELLRELETLAAATPAERKRTKGTTGGQRWLIPAVLLAVVAAGGWSAWSQWSGATDDAPVETSARPPVTEPVTTPVPPIDDDESRSTPVQPTTTERGRTPEPEPERRSVGASSSPRPVTFAPSRGSVSRESGGTHRFEPGGGAWSRSSLNDTQRRELPLRVSFRIEASASRDSYGPALKSQGFERTAGFFHEIGVRATNEEIDAGAKLRRFALWLCLNTDQSGNAHGLLRLVTADKRAESLDVGTPGVRILERVDLRGAFGDGPLDVTFELDESGYRFDVETTRGRTRTSSEGQWSRLGVGREVSEGLHAWVHAGNWGEGAGRGSVSATIAD
ncbi:MAG: serine/threonine-protein kinase [Acidobacteriota bacterium]